MKCLYLLFVLLSLLSCGTDGSKILVLFHMPTRSHNILGTALAEGLAARGHEVTFASPFNVTEKRKNVKEICLFEVLDVMKEFDFALGSMFNVSFIQMIMQFNGFGPKLTEGVLKNEAFQNLLKSDEKFDLVLLESLMNEAHFGIAQHFKAPLVVLSPSGSQMSNHLTGNLAPYSFVPNINTAYSDRMTFAERLVNAALGVLFDLFVLVQMIPEQEVLYRKYFENGPEFDELMKNVSLVLVNSHVVLETPRPYLPNMIPIGGFHVAEPKKLPQDLQTFLDDAKDGAIYFSLGSNLKSAQLPEDKLETIMNTFGKLKQKVLWKFEDENLPGKPNNVKISKWFPQNDVLAHPNIKLFISHGGLLSSTEAVYRGVPIVGMPFYGDQKSNIMNVVTAGYGLQANFGEMTEESFADVITEIIRNPKYYENVKKRSMIIQDQQEKPLDRAIFWIEHIIRHQGGQHLRSAVADLPLAQYLLLDIIAFVSVICGTLTVGMFLLCKTLFCRQKESIEEKKQKKAKPKKE